MRAVNFVSAVAVATGFILGCGGKSPNNEPANDEIAVPALLSPVNDSTDLSDSIHLTWAKVMHATMYEVQIAMASTFSGAPVDDSITPGPDSTISTVVAGLSLNSIYYWRVKAKSNRGVSSWTESWRFMTSIVSPVLSAPANGAADQPITLTMTWATVGGSLPVTYRLQVSTASDFTNTMVDDGSLALAVKIVDTLTKGVTCFWRVNATSAAGVSRWSQVSSFTVVPAAPGTPVLLLPTNGAVNRSTIQVVHWGKVDRAAAYRVQVSAAQDFSTTVVDDAAVTDTSKVLSGLSQSTLYYWRVRSINGGGTSVWTSSWSFTAIMPSVMRAIPGGTFQMGATNGFAEEQPVHTVTVSAFFMDSTEVTQEEYQSLMVPNPSYFFGDGRRPVESVNWVSAAIFCNQRSVRDGLDPVYSFGSSIAADFTKNGYRLPTEAEWEYACRAGNNVNDYYWGGDFPLTTTNDSVMMNENAIWRNNSNDSTARVASKRPNLFGLYDMIGNVHEWCHDFEGSYDSASVTDPTGPLNSGYRIFRGGSWTDEDVFLLRSAYRTSDFMGLTYSHLGFRCVRR